MDIAPAFEAATDVIRAIPRSELLLMALVAVIGGMIGSALIRHRVPMGRAVRSLSTLVLVAVLVTVVLQLSRFDPRLEVAVPQFGLPEQVVEGGETRVEMAPDGHFWLQASLNGVPARFLVDTGATVTAVSEDVAVQAGLEPRAGGIPVRIATANGAMNADISSADSLTFGNVEARGVDVVIAPSLGTTNVLGMNVLSRLESWRVEGRTLILVPGNGETG
ncbi:TIGR02281 family clan AA aspartic protease [Qipengyuania sp. MTN3-11]|uniref:retropepsin-like aspartic protease family protein n=1 Tax=Qipengyuania sp. MTN3-11 TaxID=3056557 RepID=UPI0036F31C6D